MPGDAEPELLVDTSAAIPFVLSDHDHHEAAFSALVGRRVGLAGHAAFETYAVLTRLPGPARRTPQAAGRLVAASFPHTRHLAPKAAAALLAELPADDIAGGATYDALVGAVAVAHDVPLVTRDRRALDVYRALGVDAMLLT